MNIEQGSTPVPVSADWATSVQAPAPGAGRGVVIGERAAGLPRRRVDRGALGVLWWVGAHGGAGETTLEQLFSGSRAAGHAWPLPPAGSPRSMVLLVARTSAHGLEAAQAAVREWGSGDPELRQISLLGLVLIMDAPGRLPRALRDFAELVAAGVPERRVWSLPWVEAWRTGEQPVPENAPRQAAELLGDLQSLMAVVANQTERGEF